MLSRIMTPREQLVLIIFAASVALGGTALFYHHAQGSDVVDVESLSEVDPPSSVQTPAPEVSAILVREVDEFAENLQPLDAGSSAERDHQPTRENLTVSVAGAVVLPGVYGFSPDATVEDAIDRAGGLGPLADLTDINRAARLLPNTTLVIPVRPDASGAAATDQPVYYSARANPAAYTISGWGQTASPQTVPSGASGQAVSGIQAASQTHGGLVNINTAGAAQLETLPGIGPKTAEKIMAYRAGAPFRTVEDLMQVNGIGPKKLEAIRQLVTVR